MAAFFEKYIVDVLIYLLWLKQKNLEFHLWVNTKAIVIYLIIYQIIFSSLEFLI